MILGKLLRPWRRRAQLDASTMIRSFRTLIICGAGREAELVHHLKLIRHELDKLIEYCEEAVAVRQKGGAR
jgi:hypothetical protein